MAKKIRQATVQYYEFAGVWAHINREPRGNEPGEIVLAVGFTPVPGIAYLCDLKDVAPSTFEVRGPGGTRMYRCITATLRPSP